MIKNILFCLSIVPTLVFAQNNIPVGQGVLKINPTSQPTLRFFSDTLQTTPVKTLSIGKDQNGEFIIKNQQQVNQWFLPEQLYLSYDIFFIRVDTVIGKWYKVVAHTEKGTTLWTKADAVKKFIYWNTFLLKEITSIEKGFANLDIKVAPTETSKTIKKIEDTDCFEVVEIKGDWMKIRTNTTVECSESSKPVKSGWIKWRHNNRLTISYSLMA